VLLVVSSGDTSGTHSSRYIGIPALPTSFLNNNQSNIFNGYSQFIVSAVVLIVGIGLGGILGLIICRKHNIKN